MKEGKDKLKFSGQDDNAEEKFPVKSPPEINYKTESTGKKKMNFSLIPKRHKNAVTTLFFDIIFAVAAYLIAHGILFYALDMPQNFADFEIPLAAVFIVVTIVMLVFFDCYTAMWKYAGRVEFFKIVLAYFAMFGTLMLLKVIVGFAFQVELWTPMILIYMMFSALFSFTLRFSYAILNYVKHVRFMVDEKSSGGIKRTVIIGAGYTGTLVINRFINNPHEGYFPVALIDDDPEKFDRKIYGIRVEGGMEKLDEVMYKHKANAIIIAIMSLTKSQLKNIYSQCAKFNVPIKIMPAITNAEQITSASLSLRDIKIEELLGREEFKVRQELIDNSVKDRVVCVTGGAGSIGSELCRQALNFGCRHLIIFDMHENGMFELNQEFSSKYDTSRYTLVIGTVRETQKIKETFEKYRPQIVFHAAAYKHVPMMEIAATEAVKNNIFGTMNVIKESIDANVEQFVFISTDKAVNPANVMGASKRIAEMLIQTIGKSSRMKMAAVRFGNVLGSNGSVIPIFLKQIKDGGPVTLTDRNIKRYFMTIPEAVRLVLQTGALAHSGEVYVLDMGEPVYIYDLACDLIRINGFVPEKDVPIVITGLRKGEKLFEELRYDKEMVDKTAHEGIFVTKLADLDAQEFNAKIEQLYACAIAEDEKKTIETVFGIVPSSFRNMAIEDQIKSREFVDQGRQMRN